jgi:hypothetical protein
LLATVQIGGRSFTTLRSARPALALLAQMIIDKANQADQSGGIQKQMLPLLPASYVWHKYRTSNQFFREAPTTDEGRPVTPLSVSRRAMNGRAEAPAHVARA